MRTLSRADLVPKEVSAKASDIPPVRKGVVTHARRRQLERDLADGAGRGNRQHHFRWPTKVEVADAPPPPPPKPTPPKAPISGGVLNGKAVRLVQPPYPAIARSAHAAGQVRVQIVIDENGNVVSARAGFGPSAAARRGSRRGPGVEIYAHKAVGTCPSKFPA